MELILDLKINDDNLKKEIPCVFENFTDDDYIEFEISVHEIIYDIITEEPLLFSDEKFSQILLVEITDYFYNMWIDSEICHEEDYDDIQDYVYEYIDSFFESYDIFPNRQYTLYDPIDVNKLEIQEKISLLSSLYQPEQRTNEWYENRQKLLTASNIWKIFSSESQVNSFIVEKCKPFELIERTNWFSGGSLNWGVIYEPVSVQLYEHIFSTKVGEFGCITHSKYLFLGASPDGINIDPNSDRYGRMLEIKNIVNREITGIPKEEYWIQMQIQMETCNLDYCDFLETRFKEYEEEKIFYEDEEHEWKGIVLCFIERNTSNTKPIYKYSPINIGKTKEEVERWIESIKYELRENYILYTKSFWYLDQLSCVLVIRNRIWFDAAIPKIKNTWEIIQNEIKTGDWVNRISAKKKENMEKLSNSSQQNTENELVFNFSKIPKNICLIKLDE